MFILIFIMQNNSNKILTDAYIFSNIKRTCSF